MNAHVFLQKMKDLSSFLALFCALFIGILSAEDRFVVITPEKAGTHLLTRALTFLTGKQVIHIWDRTTEAAVIHHALDMAEKDSKYFHMHAFPKPYIIDIFKQRGYKIIFLLRDPRDQLISILFYIRDYHWEYENLRMDYPFGELSFEEQIEEMITGEKYGVQVPVDFTEKRLGWMEIDSPLVYTIYFENLVGEKGGGSQKDQITELKRLSQFLHLSLSEEAIIEIADQLFGWPGLYTFRSGMIGSWKLYFTDRHKELFKSHFGNLLLKLTYESDSDW